ncbi:unnamed protein product [Mytilus coruscus]|uniref:Integrase catalytic domain-containing protein n=1 Tax=Mytilus coruscus TaxID=42192 RepID=A0A6J8CU51_MYTCO|nr:unnamed protein product [Mytilus coruscus]
MYIVVIEDYFTKFTEIFPISNMEGKNVAEVMLKGLLKRYGCSLELHSNKCRQYKSQLFQSICKFLEIDKISTTPGHPRSDVLVEREEVPKWFKSQKTVFQEAEMPNLQVFEDMRQNNTDKEKDVESELISDENIEEYYNLEDICVENDDFLNITDIEFTDPKSKLVVEEDIKTVTLTLPKTEQNSLMALSKLKRKRALDIRKVLIKTD